jgi:hypothetical protein
MMIRRFAFCLSVLVACSLAVLPSFASATPSQPLRNSLSGLKQLSHGGFREVAEWARNGASFVVFPTSPVQQVESSINNLPSQDRHAVLSWLRGNGRSALYARGASDADIGSRDPSGGAQPTASPDPWRELRLASATLVANTNPSDISILGGFAAAKRDGTTVMACVSFKNTAASAATRVQMRFTLFGENGTELGTMELERTGTFSPNIDIMTWQSYANWGGGTAIGHRGYNDNCATLKNGVAAIPILRARYITYAIMRVEYANGTSWSAP